MTQPYSCGIEMRFSDLDGYGHVNGAVYFTYLETARVKLFRGPFKEISRKGIFLVVAQAECTYKLPILFSDSVVVTVWIKRIGRSSFDLEYHIHNGAGKVFAEARTTMVCFDNKAKITVPVPDSIREMVSPETPIITPHEDAAERLE